MPRKIIIDTDPGQDDAVAILLALASPELEVLGIVAVAGNVGLHHNANNALKIAELAGRTDVPVYAGCARPMRRQLVTAEHVHGDTGLNGPDLPAPKTALQAQHGVDYIIDTLMAAGPAIASGLDGSGFSDRCDEVVVESEAAEGQVEERAALVALDVRSEDAR